MQCVSDGGPQETVSTVSLPACRGLQQADSPLPAGKLGLPVTFQGVERGARPARHGAADRAVWGARDRDRVQAASSAASHRQRYESSHHWPRRWQFGSSPALYRCLGGPPTHDQTLGPPAVLPADHSNQPTVRPPDGRPGGRNLGQDRRHRPGRARPDRADVIPALLMSDLALLTPGIALLMSDLDVFMSGLALPTSGHAFVTLPVDSE